MTLNTSTILKFTVALLLFFSQNFEGAKSFYILGF